MINKKKFCFVFIAVLIFVFVLIFIFKDVFLVSIFYKNADGYENEVNREIKSLILNSMKDRHSSLFSIEKNKLYMDNPALEQDTDTTQAKFWFIDIGDDFMDSLEKKEDKYFVKVNLYFPDDWLYYFTIEEHDGKYVISNFEIDP